MKRWEARRYAQVIATLATQLGALWTDVPPRLDEPDLSPDVAPDIERALRSSHRALLDLGMREQQDLAKTPAALMVTAFGRDEVQLQAAQLGPRGLLIKPLTASALRSCIREALRDPESPPPESPAAGPPQACGRDRNRAGRLKTDQSSSAIA